MRLLRSLGLAAGMIYALLSVYILSIWTYVSPYAAWAYVEASVDLGESQSPDFQRSIAKIAVFNPAIARVADAMVAERAPQPDGTTGDLRRAETLYRDATGIAGSGQAAAFMRLANLYTRHPELHAPTSRVLELLESAYALDYPRAGYEIGRMYETGEGVPQDLDRAAGYYFAVYDGVAEAGIRLAMLSREGRIKPPSTRFAADLEARALDLFTKRVEQTRAPKSMLALARLYQSEQLSRPDFAQALHWLETASATGSDQAAYSLALFLQRADTGLQDLAASRRILEDLAGRGNLSAIVKAARMQREGVGGPVDSEGAMVLYRTAMARGSAPAMLKYGEALIAGDGTAPDRDAGMALVAKSAAAGDPNAALRLARALETGVDVERDVEAAIEWYEEAGNLGSRAAMLRLADAYRDGSVVEADQAKYLHWGMRALDAGATNRGLERDVGAALLGGEGVAADRERGFKLLLRAADQGDGSAALSVARGYAYGVGVPQSATKAVEWYRRAAATGRISAYSELGHAYASGFGVPMDPDLAFEYFGKAARAGHSGSMLDLGRMYVSGFGVARDAKRAEEWFVKAAELGNATAMIELANLNRERLTPGASDSAALAWLERGAALESGRAAYVLGLALTEGVLAPPDRARAEALFRKAVELDYAPAKARLLQMKTTGDEM